MWRARPGRHVRSIVWQGYQWRRGITIAADSALLKISPEVRDAVRSQKPVVALETTIYTHGYPYPDNVALASELESIVRVNGGVPATIGIVDGVARVGLTAEELIDLAASAGKESTLKLSRRDLSYALGTRLAGKRFHGGTTIAATMILAHLAGIRVFATGGLGGVHRGAESSMDISADLTELGRTPVAVISSGCKSFLDIPRTLEYLETEGVTLGTFADGRKGTVDFPAFWSRDSGVLSPLTIEDEREAAAIIHAHFNLPLHSGLFFANPIPLEASIPKANMDVFIEEAIRLAETAGASGKDNTPFVLAKIKELSGGKSVSANRSLIMSNVKRGTMVAKELARLDAELEGHKQMLSSFARHVPAEFRNSGVESQPEVKATAEEPRDIVEPQDRPAIVVAGGLACDYCCDAEPSNGDTVNLGSSNPANITQSLGGVAHNVAKAIHYLGVNVKLLAFVGKDLNGKSALTQLIEDGMRTDGIETVDGRTACYVAINDERKDLMVAMADMDILNTSFSPELRKRWFDELSQSTPEWFVADANWNTEVLFEWLQTAKAARCKSVFEPVSVAKSVALMEPSLSVFPNHLVDLAAPNSLELAAMHAAARSRGLFERQDWWAVIDDLGIPSSGARGRLVDTTSADLVDQGVPQQAIQLLPFVPCVTTKLGPDGVLLTMLLRKGDARLSSPEASRFIISRSTNPDSQVGGVYMRLYPRVEEVPQDQIRSVNGVGDTFLGTLVAGMHRTGRGVEELVDVAQRAAVMTLRAREAVSPELRSLVLDGPSG